MRVVLDTNVLLISIPSNSKYRPIFDSLINGDFELAISNEIINEYLYPSRRGLGKIVIFRRGLSVKRNGLRGASQNTEEAGLASSSIQEGDRVDHVAPRAQRGDDRGGLGPG